MTPEIERFLQGATRPLAARPDERAEAGTELMARLGHLGVPLDQLDLSEPTRQIENAPGPRPWRRRTALLAASLLLVAGTGVVVYRQTIAVMGAAQATRLEIAATWGASFGYDEDFRLKELEHYIAQHAPGMLVDPREGERMFASALERHPGHLGLLQQHLQALPAEAPQCLTDEQRGWIERADAGNALWPLLEAEWRLEAAEELPSSEQEFAREKAWVCFREAAQCAVLRDHTGSLRRELVEAFPMETGMMGGMLRASLSRLVSPSLGLILADPTYRMLRWPQDRIETRLAELGVAQRDRQTELFEDWERVVGLIVASDQLAGFADQHLLMTLSSHANCFRDSFASPASDDRRGAAFEARSEAWDRALTLLAAAGTSGALTDLEDHAPLRLLDHTEGFDLIPVERLAPASKTERAMFDRLVSIVAAFLWLVVAAMCGFEMCRRRRTTRGLAQGLMPLLGARDWVWILGLGCLAPWAFMALLSFATPLGARDRSLAEEENVLAWLIRWGAAWTLSLTLLMQTVQWRWAVRGGFLGLGSRILWAGWVVAGLAAAGYAAAGAVRYFAFADDEQLFDFLLGISGLIALGLLWAFWFAVQSLFTPGAGALRANVVTRTMLPCCIALGFLMLLAAGLFQWQEAHWMQRDTLLPSWTSGTHFNAVEQLEGERWARLFREHLGDL